MQSSSTSKPNVIVFFTDQQRWDTLGLNGCPLGLTPNLDRLARKGTFFKNGVTPQPVCGPARSCLQTGQYATTTGVWKNGPGLKDDAPKLAELFNEAGYRTGYIGKWHLAGPDGDDAPVVKEARAGYQDWLGANVVELTSGPYSARFWDTDNNEVQLPGYRSDAQTDAAIRYIFERNEEPENPFLLYLSYIEPHHQNTDDSYPAPHGMETDYLGDWLPADLQALGGSSPQHWAGYCAMIKRLDDGLGRLMDALESTGQDKNTVVAFISDHGCHFKTRNAEYKRSPHESSIRVPFALWGANFDGGGEHSCPANLVDLAPTLLDAAGIDIPDAMEGNSLLPATRSDYSGLPEESFIQFGDSFLCPGRAIHTGRWKYAVEAAEEHKRQPNAPAYVEMCLYDLQTDPYELQNLVANEAFQPLLEELRARMLNRIKEVEGLEPELIPAPNPEPAGQRRIEYPNSRI